MKLLHTKLNFKSFWSFDFFLDLLLVKKDQDMGLVRHFASQQSHRSWMLKVECDLIVILQLQ